MDGDEAIGLHVHHNNFLHNYLFHPDYTNASINNYRGNSSANHDCVEANQQENGEQLALFLMHRYYCCVK